MGYRNYAPACGFIVAKDGNGDFLTIGAALTAAATLGVNTTIFVRPGTYTENPVLISGIDIVAFTADSSEPNVTINGNCTFSSTGTVSISGIRLQTNSSAFLTVSGSAASIVNLSNCYLNCSNNTGITFTSSSSNAQININNCTGNIGTTGISLYTMSSTGTINMDYVYYTNTGLSTTASSNSAGVVNYFSCWVFFATSTSSTGTIVFINSLISCTSINTVAVTTSGTGTTSAQLTNFGGGSASAISVGTGTTFNLIACTITSSNTDAITGSGTLQYSSVSFGGNSTTLINTSTLVPSYTNLGKYQAPGQPCFLAALDSTTTNAWGDAGTYTVIYSTSVFDQNSNYATGTGIFTAPVTGKYQFSTSTVLTNTGGLGANAEMVLAATSRTLKLDAQAFVTSDPNGFIYLNGTCIIDMTAGDTAKIQINGSSAASTKTAAFYGQSGIQFTWFSGSLLN